MLQDQAPVPSLVVADNTRSLLPHIYMIYKKLPGGPVANHWHEMTDRQRKQFIGELCGYLKVIDNLPPSSYSRNEKLDSFDWQKHICDRIEVKLAIIGERKLLPETTISSIQQFVAQTKHVLKAQKLGLVFWDVHFDNLLVDEKFALAGLIDLESTDVCSIDYRLMTVRLMQRHPKLYLSKEMESYAKTKDYTHLLKWYRDFYPDMFAFEHIDARIDLYELLDIVSKLPDWPRATILRQRLKNTLG